MPNTFLGEQFNRMKSHIDMYVLYQRYTVNEVNIS
jgi:hypothetical protein